MQGNQRFGRSVVAVLVVVVGLMMAVTIPAIAGGDDVVPINFLNDNIVFEFVG